MHTHAAQLIYTFAKQKKADSAMLTCAAVYLQCEINEKMRGILVDWLVEVHLKFKVSSTAQLTCHKQPRPTAVHCRLQAFKFATASSMVKERQVFESAGQPLHTCSRQHALHCHVSYAVATH
jgi:hypothetical protein